MGPPIRTSEVFVLIAMIVHLINAPGTKVEESFNMQATHDMIYHSWNISAYDHLDFPGVVPRTFAGPAYLAVFGLPVRAILWYFEGPKVMMQLFVRFALGLTVVLAFCNYARAVEEHYGEEVAKFLRLITISQFHFMFYASRLLPNTFALVFVLMVYQRCMNYKYYSAVRWATAAALLFRCELVLLFGPIFITAYFNGHIKFFDIHEKSAIMTGIKTAFKVLFATVPLDTLLWQRPVWPEAEVAWFNVFQNRSHEYGVSPFFWYFTSALPRSMLSAIFLVPFGFLADRRLKCIILPVLVFIGLYSFLPHKELRFIMYAIPPLNLGAAVICARWNINKWKSIKYQILSLGCYGLIFSNFIASLFFAYAAARNYPGFYALGKVQFDMRIDAQKPISVYIDNACAQTGVTRFLQMYDSWEYNKTESLTPKDMERFDFILVGTYENDLSTKLDSLSQWHRVMGILNGFHKFTIESFKGFPYYLPKVELAEKAAVLRKKWEL